MGTAVKQIDDAAANQLFREARTTYNWLPDEVTDEALAAAWDLAKFGPTAMNCQPMRIKVIRGETDKGRLRAQAAGGNQTAIDNAPVQLLLYWSPTFYEKLPEFFPSAPQMADVLKDDPAMAAGMGQSSAWLQAAYLIMALRAVGLAVGPMTGADFPALDAEFFDDNSGKSFLILNVGYAAKPANSYPRSPRLTWEQVQG